MRCDHCVIALFILGDFYYYFIQQLCAYWVNFSDTRASDTSHINGELTD